MNKRILHVVYSLDAGGMENGIVNMANKFVPEDSEIIILCLDHVGVMGDRLDDDIRIFELSKNDGFDWWLIPKICTFIDDCKPDVVHTHNLGPLIYISISRFTKHRFRVIHGEHASLTLADVVHKKKLQRTILYYFVECIHTVGRGMTTQIKTLGVGRKYVNTFVNGVNIDYYNESISSLNPCSDLRMFISGLKIICIMGRFGKYKGHERLLAAFESICDHDKDVGLLIVGGGGEHEEKVQRLVEEHPYKEKIFMAGYQQDTRVYYHATDLLIVVSENEGLSNCMLEAMACGVPVLSSNSCGAAEIILNGINGFLLEQNEPQCIAETVLHLLNTRSLNLSKIGKVAKDCIKDRYALDCMHSRYYAAYQYFGESILLN